MIHLVEGAASGGSGDNNLWVVIVGAVVSVITAFIVPAFTLRSSNKSATQQQHQAVLQQGNALYDRLKSTCDVAEKERDEARREADAYRKERDAALDDLNRLKHRVWAGGHDPETIGREPPHARPPQERQGR